MSSPAPQVRRGVRWLCLIAACGVSVFIIGSQLGVAHHYVAAVEQAQPAPEMQLAQVPAASQPGR